MLEPDGYVSRANAEEAIAVALEAAEAGFSAMLDVYLDRIDELERRNAALGALANGGVPDGYVLVKATE